MNASTKKQTETRGNSRPTTAEERLKELGIKLPSPLEPFGIYAEAVQTGNLLFLTGMLPTEGRPAKFIGRVGAELDVEAGRKAAHLAALNSLAVARGIWDRSAAARSARYHPLSLGAVSGKIVLPCKPRFRPKGRSSSPTASAAN